MLLGIWIMGNEQTSWSVQDVVFAVISLLVVVMLMVGVDIRRTHQADEQRKRDE
jgi:uncharacterized protein with FMN-binding domain